MPGQVLYLKTNSAENSKERVWVDFGGSGRYGRWFEINFGNSHGTVTSYFFTNCDKSNRYPRVTDRQFNNLPDDLDKEWTINKLIDRLIVTCNGVKVLEYVFATAENEVCAEIYGVQDRTVYFSTRDTASDYFYVGQPQSGIIPDLL